MSGFAGFVNYRYRRENAELILKQMNDTLIHRGSDIEAYYSDENLNFGYRCFSIPDMQEKKQSMTKKIEDREYIIIYDGIITNREELIEKLKERNISLSTNHDEELLINAYLIWNDNFVQYLEGAFSLVIWDKYSKKVYMARDKLGIKPLFYTTVENEFIFASEIKALLKFPGVESCIGDFGIAQLLGLRNIRIPGKSIFKKILEVKAGNYMVLLPNDIKEEKYWNIGINFEEEINIDNVINDNTLVSFKNISETFRKSVITYDLPGSLIDESMSENMIMRNIIFRLYNSKTIDIELANNLINKNINIDIKEFLRCKLKEIERTYIGNEYQKRFRYNLDWCVIPYIGEVSRIYEKKNLDMSFVNYKLFEKLYSMNNNILINKIYCEEETIKNIINLLKEIIEDNDSPILDIINKDCINELILLENNTIEHVELLSYFIKTNMWMEEYRIRIK